MQEHGPLPVPLKLRNAPTKLMESMGYGGGYKYPHDFDGHYVAEQYLPDALRDEPHRQALESGLEKALGERWRASGPAPRSSYVGYFPVTKSTRSCDLPLAVAHQPVVQVSLRDHPQHRTGLHDRDVPDVLLRDDPHGVDDRGGRAHHHQVPGHHVGHPGGPGFAVPPPAAGCHVP